MRSTIRILISLIFVGALSLSACGVKGPLEPPPEASKAETDTGAGTPGTAKKKGKPHRSFILDGLLR